jgi:hypothetical protein
MRVGIREIGLIACLAIFLVAPSVPNAVLTAAVNSYIGVAALLFVTLVALRMDMVLGIAVFLAAGALFLENRKRLVAGTATVMAPQVASQPAPVSTLDEPAEPVVETEVHPPHEEPTVREHSFEPDSESHSNAFERVGESINEKQPLPTVPANSSAAVADLMERAGLTS